MIALKKRVEDLIMEAKPTRVAIMGRWNATCGISLHTELLGRKLVEKGHQVSIYAPTLESAEKDWYHRHIPVEDEPWVYRIYDETDEFHYPSGGSIYSERIFSDDFDAFIVESYVRLPVNELKKLVPEIKRKAPLILVVHLGYVRQIDPLMDIDWDAIVVFDRRYIDEIISVYGEKAVEKSFEIPYPYAIIEGVKLYRPEFYDGSPLLFTFGRHPGFEFLDYLSALRKLARNKSFTYWMMFSDGDKPPVEERWLRKSMERPVIRKLYSYLKGVDIHLLPKNDTRAVVVSSTIAQTLYSGVPTIVPDTRHFELLPTDEEGYGVVVKYRIGYINDLIDKLTNLMDDEDLRKKISQKAREYALRNSDEVVAERFVKLLKSI